MLLEQEVMRLFSDLIRHEAATIGFDGEEIVVRIFDHASKVSLSTIVYRGDRYIPQSVRRCIAKNLPIGDSSIKTYFVVNEAEYDIRLNYLGGVASFTHSKFKQLLEEFHDIAQEWREILDEQDRNDLVHVHV